MIKEYFQILTKIPKGHFGYPLAISIILIVVNQFTIREEDKIDLNRLIFILCVLFFIIIIWTQIQWIRFALKELISNRAILMKPTPIRLRPMTNEIALQNFVFNEIELEIAISRKWYPDAKTPSIIELIGELKIRGYLCSKCKSEFSERFVPDEEFGNLSYLKCNCPYAEEIECDDWERLIKIAEKRLREDIRQNINKYWEMYKKEYLRITNGHPELHEEPITTFDKSC